MVSMGKIRVAVLMGGMSSEHEVSLNSGRGVVAALAAEGFEALPVTITQEDGMWIFPDEDPVFPEEAIGRLKDIEPECVFIALHGKYGEDGRIQGMLDLIDLPYTTSGCAASAICMDKIRSKVLVQSEDIRVAGHIGFGPDTWMRDQDAVLAVIDEDLGWPCVVKPPCEGSSFGITIAQDKSQFIAGVEEVLMESDTVMIEEFIKGREVTCAVLDDEGPGNIRALPVTEIKPKRGAFFDYEAKYTPGAAEEITPAELDEELTAQVQDMAVRAHLILGCGIWSRSDFIIDDSGACWIEINTVPGLTGTSLYPQACAAAGISYGEMVSRFVKAAMLRKTEEV
jgi:D-alanine-D-alanine ligase